MNIAIIGGGMAGLGAAFELAGTGGHRITIFEKSPTLGGLAFTIDVDGVPLEPFYHHIFPTYYDFLAIAGKLGIREKIFFRKARTGIFWRGRLFEFTSAIDLLRFSPLSLVERIRAGRELARMKFVRNWHRFEHVSATAWLTEHFGKHSYDVLWKPLLESKFADLAEEVSMTWFWGRVYERPFRFGYFRGGFKTLTSALAEYLETNGVVIKTGTPVAGIAKEGAGFRVSISGGTEYFDRVIVAAPPEPLKKIAGSLFPPTFARELDHLPYMGTVSLVLELEHSLIPVYWLNINDTDSPFGVVIEHTNFVRPETYGGKRILYVAKYVSASDPFYLLPDESLWQKCFALLKHVNPAFEERWVIAKHLFRTPFTQPVVEVGYEKRRPQFKTPIPGLWWVSMSHIYPWDRGTDHSFHAGRELAREVLTSGEGLGGTA